MDHLDELADRAQSSELFSSPYLERDAARFLSEQAEAVRELASRARAGGRRVYFVGSGGSWASMYSGKYLCDRLTGAVSDVLPSYELTWRGPRGLDKEALVVLASYSGRTEDTLEALRFARNRGAETVALVRHARLAPRPPVADHVFAYDSPGLYCLPLLAVTLFAGEWGMQDGNDEAVRAARGGAGATRPDGRRLPLAARPGPRCWPNDSPTPTCCTASAPGRCSALPTSSG